MLDIYKQHFAEILTHKTGQNQEEILEMIEIPPENIPGDLAFPCFQLSKIIKKSPIQVAQELSQGLSSGNLFSKFEPVGPYINVHINKINFINEVIKTKTFHHKPKKEKVLVEYMSANPNKPLHIGQARNICIGDSMRRIFHYLGYETHSSNYGDDSGVNVGYNIVGHLFYGLPIETEKKFDHYCGEIYEEMRKKDEDPEFKKVLSETLLKIEEGHDPDIYKIHQEYTKKCALEQIKTCRRMNASFDLINRETDVLHLKFFAEAMTLLKDKGFIKFEEEGEAAGCWIIDLSSLPEFQKEEKQYQILIKSDGVATYVAKDIAFAMRKLGYLQKDFSYKTFAHQPDGSIIYSTHSREESEIQDKFGNYNRAITVIDNRQAWPQEIVKSSLKLLGYINKDKQYDPLTYGVVYLTPKTLMNAGYQLTEEEQEQKRLPFASRKGRTVTIDEMLQMLHEKAYRETKERNPEKDAERLDDTSEKIAVGCLRFFLIKGDIKKDIVFDVDEVLDMQGETGAYLLYTGARIQSIIDQAQPSELPNNIGSLLTQEDEFNLIKKITQFEDIITESTELLTPDNIAKYLLELARMTNTYYANTKILIDDEATKQARIYLLQKVKETLKTGMDLLGIQLVERM